MKKKIGINHRHREEYNKRLIEINQIIIEIQKLKGKEKIIRLSLKNLFY